MMVIESFKQVLSSVELAWKTQSVPLRIEVLSDNFQGLSFKNFNTKDDNVWDLDQLSLQTVRLNNIASDGMGASMLLTMSNQLLA